MVNFKKSTKGITMIALIITILVLLVLATVTIRIMINNGIIGTSRRGAEDYIVGQEKEAIHTGFQNYQQELELDENAELKVEGATVTPNAEDGWDIVFNTTGHAYHLKSDGIIEGDEIIIADKPTTPPQEENTTPGGKTPTPSENTTPIEEPEEEKPTEIAVGDYVDYTYDTVTEPYNLEKKYTGYTADQTISQSETQLKWRIININTSNNTVDLISDVTTDQAIYLQGNKGYNNGVYFLNDLCAKHYSNSTLGIKARSIQMEDFEKQLTEEGLNNKNNYTVTNYVGDHKVKYGETRKYSGRTMGYPKLYEKEKGYNGNTAGIGVSEVYYTAPATDGGSSRSSLTVTQNYFSPYGYKDKNAENIIKLNQNGFWVASRWVSCTDYTSVVEYNGSTNYPSINYGIYRMSKSGSSVFGTGVYDGKLVSYISVSASSPGLYDYARGARLRPVVTVNADWIGATGGTASNPRSLTKT